MLLIRQRKPFNAANSYDSEEEYHLPSPSSATSPKRLSVRHPFLFASNKIINFRILTAIFLISLFVRLFQISNPSQVVFDEVHFGGFARKYIKSDFFMDVHPPLGKLLIAASGLFAGYNGTFTFKSIGDDYIANNVPYISMRILPGFLGVLLAPMGYITLRNMGASQSSAILAGLLVVFENALACQSRLILLDSILIFFTALSFMMWTDFLACQNEAFEFGWWYSLFMTGLSLGLALSVKWVGLFIIATVGVSTIKNLWDMLDDVNVTWTVFKNHFLARALCLIVVPITVYMVIFEIHFLILSNSGSGSGFMSAEFQSTLKGNEIASTYLDVGYYSKVYLRHIGTNGGYLHSHPSTYPVGSKQQQITLYPFRDSNSDFLVHPGVVRGPNGTLTFPTITQFQKVKHNDIIRLEHIPTKKFLHSHDIKAPVSGNDIHNEVSGYSTGNEKLGDLNDNWRVLIHDGGSTSLKAIRSKFSLVHVNTGRSLFSHDVKLPDWGFKQQEVTCAQNGKKKLIEWMIEKNENNFLTDASPKVNYQKPGFLSRFFESHKVMWDINNGLTSTHPFESRPSSWPSLIRGISFWQSKGMNVGHAQIYLIGNPFIWGFATLSLVFYLMYVGLDAVAAQRKMRLFSNHYVEYMTCWAGLAFSAWAFHYLPFFLMNRQLFLHHYLPALYFSILTFTVFFEILTMAISRRRWMAMLVVVGIAVCVYCAYAPLTYGFGMSKRHCKMIKLRYTWDWDCNKASD